MIHSYSRQCIKPLWIYGGVLGVLRASMCTEELISAFIQIIWWLKRVNTTVCTSADIYEKIELQCMSLNRIRFVINPQFSTIQM